MDLLFIVDVEVGSHGNSLSNCTHASSNINDGCNGTSMNKSSHNSSRRVSEGQEIASQDINYSSVFLHLSHVQCI